MANTYTPTQHIINDPYQQRLLQFDTQDSRVYLSRVSNFLLKALGNDAYIKGFDIITHNFSNNIFILTVGPGILIQDSTLIEVTSNSELTIDVSGFDECNGYLIVYTDYKHIESISQNVFSLKLAYVSFDGLTFIRDTSPPLTSWTDRNRFYIALFQFEKGTPNVATEKVHPGYFYLNGKKYYRLGGALNFERTAKLPTENLEYYNLPHNYNATDSFKLVAQLRDHADKIKSIQNIKLEESKILLNIDEHKPLDSCYQLTVSNPSDAILHTINKSSIPLSGGSIGVVTIDHNLNQKYIIAELYDNNYNKVYPRYIKFVNNNSLKISFENMISDLQDSYKLVLIKNHTTVIPISLEELVDNFIDHDLDSYKIIVNLIDPTDNLYQNISGSVFGLTTSNKLLFNANACDFIEGDYNIIIYNNVDKSYELFQDNSWFMSHHIVSNSINDSNLINNKYSLTHRFDNMLPAVGFIDLEANTVISLKDINIITNSEKVDFDLTGYPAPINGIGYVYYFDKNIIYYLEDLPVGFAPEGFKRRVLYTHNDIFETTLVFQVYDGQNNIINPTIIVYDENHYEFEFPNGLDLTDVRVLLLLGYKSYSQEFTTTPDLAPVLVNHNLNSKFIYTQIFETEGIDPEVVYPNNIHLTDLNNITIDVSNLEPSKTHKINVITGLLKPSSDIQYRNGYYREFSSEDLTGDYIIINHNLNFLNPVIQVYDDSNYIYTLVSINIINKNSIKMVFSEDLSKYYKVIIMKPDYSGEES